MSSDTSRIPDAATDTDGEAEPGAVRAAGAANGEAAPVERTRPGFPDARPPAPLPPIPRSLARRPPTLPPPPGASVPPPGEARPVEVSPPETSDAVPEPIAVAPPPDLTPRPGLAPRADLAPPPSPPAAARLTPPPIPRSKPRARTDPAGVVMSVRGIESPLVGRERELGEMVEAVHRAIEFQAPQLITIAGTQGTGKSRLIEELIGKVGGPPVRVYRGRAQQGGPRYNAISRLLRDRFGIADLDGEDAVRGKVVDEVKRVFADQRVDEVLHFLGAFLELHTDESPFLVALRENPAQYDEIGRTILCRFIEIDSRGGPLLLVLDDLQWADEDTLTVLRALGVGLGGSPVALVASGRPDFLVRLPEWSHSGGDHLRIDLRNLDHADGGRLFGNLLARCGAVPREIVEDAVEMTGGNPAFLEQLVRLFLANGTIDTSGEVWRLDPDKAAETDLPISVEEAIEARVAALDEDERDVLERGAVFGNVFWLGAVVSLGRLTRGEAPGEQLEWTTEGDATRRRVTAVIDALVERDYLLRLEPEDSTVDGAVELVFKHNLERELIAGSTEPRRLARYHRLAAQWLETKLTATSEEQLEFLAQLYERGGDKVHAARCYRAGGDKARARYANEQAVELYGKALALMGDDDAIGRLGALHDLGSVLDLIGRGEEAAARFRSMLELAWLFDYRAKGGAAHGRLARIFRKHGEYDRAMEHLRAAQELFEAAGDKRGIAGTLDDIGKVHWMRGAYGQALEFHRQALALRRALDDKRSIALSLANIGRVHHDSGGFKAANKQFREALDLRREIGDLPGVVQSLCDLADVHVADGASELGLGMLTEAHKIATDIGDRVALCEVLARLGECRASLGLFEEARAHLIQAIEIGRSLGHKVAIADASRRLAEVELALSDVPAAAEHARQALSISESVGSRVQVGTAHRVLAETIAVVGLDPERIQRAEEHYRQAVEILAGMKNELELARCYRAYAGFCESVGKPADAAKLRLRADEIFGRLRGAAAVE